MDANQFVNDIKTIMIKFKKEKIVICGHPEAIEKAKKMIDSDKEQFSIYNFYFMSDAFFEKDQLYMITDERVKNVIISLLERAEKENKDHE